MVFLQPESNTLSVVSDAYARAFSSWVCLKTDHELLSFSQLIANSMSVDKLLTVFSILLRDWLRTRANPGTLLKTVDSYRRLLVECKGVIDKRAVLNTVLLAKNWEVPRV